MDDLSNFKKYKVLKLLKYYYKERRLPVKEARENALASYREEEIATVEEMVIATRYIDKLITESGIQ